MKTTAAQRIRAANRERKPRTCLGCGRTFVTDRCHRSCRVCERRNLRNGHYLPRIGHVSHRQIQEAIAYAD